MLLLIGALQRESREGELMRLLDLHLGRPLTRGALTVFPIWNGHAVTARGYDLAGSALSVTERAGSAVVEELVVTNGGARPALVLEGELLEGGQQHRVASRTMLVAAGQSQVLEVRCVEQGRWSGAGRHVRSGRRAPLSVRAAQGQSATWDRVRRFEQRYGDSPTRSLLDATRGVSERARQLVAGIQPLPYQSGVLLCLAGQPVQAEVYDSWRTLGSVWDALLQSAALDALDLPAEPTPGRRARRFLDRVSAIAVSESAGGLGTALHGHSPYARLDALTWRGRAVHTVAVNPRYELVAA